MLRCALTVIRAGASVRRVAPKGAIVRSLVPASVPVFVLVTSVAGAETAIPAAVAARLEEIGAICREVDGKPMLEQVLTRTDLNSDGQLDFVVDVGKAGCDGAASIYGDREKEVVVYVGDGTGDATEAFRGMAYGATLEDTAKSPRLWLTVAGRDCGKPSAPDFASESFCERPLAWSAVKRAFDSPPLSAVKMIE